MNMEDCPVHEVEKNPDYPFTCPCKETFTTREWVNVASAEYHGWAAYGEYHNWVRESPEAHDKYVKMLWDYQLVYTRMYRKWLLETVVDEIYGQCMTDRQEISSFLLGVGKQEYYEGPEDE